MKLRTLLPIVVIVSAAAFTAQPAAAQVLAPDMLRSSVIKETEIRPFAAAVKNVQRVTDFYSPLAAATGHSARSGKTAHPAGRDSPLRWPAQTAGSASAS